VAAVDDIFVTSVVLTVGIPDFSSLQAVMKKIMTIDA
jgi:hypothetical protein